MTTKVEYYSNNKIKSIYSYDEKGQKHGVCSEYYPQNGQLRRRRSYVHGGISGALECYHQNGQLAFQKTYGDTKDVEKRYDSSGNLIYQRVQHYVPLYDEGGFVTAAIEMGKEEQGEGPDALRQRVNAELDRIKAEKGPEPARRLARHTLVREYRARFANVFER